MIRAPITIPVRYREREGTKTAHRFGLVETTIPYLEDPREAPVAVRWDDGSNIHEYRVFDGSLWSPSTDGWGHRRYETARLWPGTFLPGETPPDRIDWARWLVDARRADRLLEHPLRSRETWVRREANRTDVKRFDHELRYNDEFDRMSAQVLANAADAMVVGGMLWHKSVGPILTYPGGQNRVINYGARLSYAHPDDRWDAETIESRAFRFSALDRDSAAEFVSRGFGKATEIGGEAPEVLIRDGYSVDLLPLTGESTAWHMVWALKGVDLGSAPHAAVSAMLGLRQALQERWPDDDLDFSPKVHETTWRQTLGKTIPDPAPLVPVMAALSESCAGLVPEGVLRAWRVSVDRLRHAAPAAMPDADDADTFATLTV